MLVEGLTQLGLGGSDDERRALAATAERVLVDWGSDGSVRLTLSIVVRRRGGGAR